MFLRYKLRLLYNLLQSYSLWKLHSRRPRRAVNKARPVTADWELKSKSKVTAAAFKIDPISSEEYGRINDLFSSLCIGHWSGSPPKCIPVRCGPLEIADPHLRVLALNNSFQVSGRAGEQKTRLKSHPIRMNH